MNADDATNLFTNNITETERHHVRSKRSTVRISSHPWLNDRCKAALVRKQNARGAPNALPGRDRCSAIIHDEYSGFVNKMKAKLKKSPN